MSIQDHEPDGLGDSLKGLTTSVEQTMAALHSLNVYILNSHTFEKYRHEFPTLRHSLKHHWIGITEVLQQLYNVIDQLVFMSSSIEGESDHECIAFLKELDEPSTAASISLRGAIMRNEEILTKFETSGSKFVLQRRHNVDLMVVPEFIAPPVAPGLSAETSQFVRNSLAAANPAGVPSAIAALSSLKDTQLHLTAILQFWTTLWSNCRTILTGATQNYRQILEEIFKNNHASWEADRQDLRDAITHILRSVDAISIAALPTPRRSSSHPLPSASNVFKSALVYTRPFLRAPDSRPQSTTRPQIMRGSSSSSLSPNSAVPVPPLSTTLAPLGSRQPTFADAGLSRGEAANSAPTWWKRIFRAKFK